MVLTFILNCISQVLNTFFIHVVKKKEIWLHFILCCRKLVNENISGIWNISIGENTCPNVMALLSPNSKTIYKPWIGAKLHINYTFYRNLVYSAIRLLWKIITVLNNGRLLPAISYLMNRYVIHRLIFHQYVALVNCSVFGPSLFSLPL